MTRLSMGLSSFGRFSRHCKFRDCKHQTELSCALIKAVDEGKILPVRLQNYRNILASQDEQA